MNFYNICYNQLVKMKKTFFLLNVSFMSLLITSCGNSLSEKSQSILLNPTFNPATELSTKYSVSNPIIISFSGISNSAGPNTAEFKSVEAFQNRYPFIRVSYQSPANLSLKITSGNVPNVIIQQDQNEISNLLSAKLIYSIEPFLSTIESESFLAQFPVHLLEHNRMGYEKDSPLYSLPLGYRGSVILKNKSVLNSFNNNNQKVFSYDNFMSHKHLFNLEENAGNFLGLISNPSFDFLMKQWGINPVTVSSFHDFVPNFINEIEQTLDLVNFLKSSYQNGSLNNIDFSTFASNIHSYPNTYLYTSQLVGYANLFNSNSENYEFSQLSLKNDGTKLIDYIPFHIYLAKPNNQTDDTLLASWLLMEFLANEGSIYFTTNWTLLPINHTTKTNPDYLTYLNANPIVKSLDAYFEEILFSDNSEFTINPISPFSQAYPYWSKSLEYLNLLDQDYHPDYVNVLWTEEEKLAYHFRFLLPQIS